MFVNSEDFDYKSIKMCLIGTDLATDYDFEWYGGGRLLYGVAICSGIAQCEIS